MSQKIFVKSLIVVLALAISATAQAEYPVVEWTRQLGTAGREYGRGVSIDGSGNVYVTGGTEGGLDGNASAPDWDVYLTKYDVAGAKLWTRQLDSGGYDHAHGLSVDGSGNAYVTGDTHGNLDGNTSAGDHDIFLSKYDTAGTKLWTRQLGTDKNEWSYGVSVDGSGNAYVTGFTHGDLDGNASAGSQDIFLAKYDTDGAKLWTRLLGSARSDRGYGVSVDGDGNAYVTGRTYGGIDGNTNVGDYDIFLTKYDTVGTKQWTRQLGTSREDIGYGVSVDGSGNAYVTGITRSGLDGNTFAGTADIFLSKYDTGGAKLWTRLLGTPLLECGFGVSVDGSGNAYVTGYTYGNLDGTNEGMSDMFLAKYATDGTKLWTKQLGTTSPDHGYGVSVDSSGNAYVTGSTMGDFGGNINAGGPDMFLVKISSIPEPGSIVLLAGIALTTLLYRKRKQV